MGVVARGLVVLEGGYPRGGCPRTMRMIYEFLWRFMQLV